MIAAGFDIRIVQHGTDWRQQLPASTQRGIKKLKKFSAADWREWYEQVKEKERKRAKYLTQ